MNEGSLYSRGGYTTAVSDILDPRIRPTEKHILMILGMHADTIGSPRCLDINYEYLEAATKRSMRTVKAAVARLMDFGYVLAEIRCRYRRERVKNADFSFVLTKRLLDTGLADSKKLYPDP